MKQTTKMWIGLGYGAILVLAHHLFNCSLEEQLDTILVGIGCLIMFHLLGDQ